MKNLLFITTLLIGLSACDMADDGDYKGMATDMCGCFNEATEGLSDKGRKVIEDAGKKDTDVQTALMEYAQESPMEAMQDGQVLAGLEEGDVMSCISKLETKYADVYTTDSEAEIQDKLIEVMKDIKGCELTYTFTKAGLGM